MNQSWFLVAILFLFVTLTYFPTFSGEFILDDHTLIENNPHVRDASSIPSYFAQEDGITDRRDVPGYHTGYYRPLINLTYWVDYKIWGMSAPGFRTSNLILHLLTCLVLFKTILLMIGDRQIAFWASLIFAVHPANTETVSWVSSRNNILVTLFGLGSFYFYVKGLGEGGSKARILSVILFLGALFSKEFGIMLLPIFFFYQIAFTKKKKNLSTSWKGYLPYLMTLLLYFLLRVNVTHSLLTPSESGDLLRRLYFLPYVLAFNLMIVFLPHDLHSLIIHYPPTYLNPQAIFGFAVASLFVVFLCKERKDKIILFSLLAFGVSIFPVLQVVPTSAVSLVSMRWLYFPMAFLFIGLFQFIYRSLKSKSFLTLSMLGLVSIYLGGYAATLNQSLWHDEEKFFQREVLFFNNFFYAGGLAETFYEKKAFAKAEKYFKISLRHYPKGAKNYMNYAALLIDTGRPKEALAVLDKARSLPMTHGEQGQWFNNAGMANFQLKEYGHALAKFLKAVEYAPQNDQFWANLGGAYGEMGDYADSVRALKRGLEIRPDSKQVLKNLAMTYVRMGKHKEAISLMEGMPQRVLESMGMDELKAEAKRALESQM